jgi:hypothetical protein
MARWTVGTAIGLSIFGIVVLACYIPQSVFARSWVDRRAILDAARNADSIVIIEHSDRFDPGERASMPDRGNWNSYHEKIFKTIRLPHDDLGKLSDAFPFVWSLSQLTEENLCIFSPHHRLEFATQGGHVDTLEICFICGDLDWNSEGKHLLWPKWGESIRAFIKSMGMNPDIGEANQSTDPTLSSGTPAAGQPARHP